MPPADQIGDGQARDLTGKVQQRTFEGGLGLGMPDKNTVSLRHDRLDLHRTLSYHLGPQVDMQCCGCSFHRAGEQRPRGRIAPTGQAASIPPTSPDP